MVTAGAGKFFSNGLGLDWLGTGEEDMFGFLADVPGLWARILEAPFPTVAAVNGHAFAGGAMFALAFDQRVMREDRGFWCVNEVLLGMDLTPGMGALVQARLDKHTAHKAVTQNILFGNDRHIWRQKTVVQRPDRKVQPGFSNGGEVLDQCAALDPFVRDQPRQALARPI